LYIWDDELDTPRVRSLLQRIAEKNSEVEGGSSNIEYLSSNAEVLCKKCELLSENLREFGKDIGKEIGIEFGKELGKEYGKETASEKHMKTKKKLQYERKKNAGLMIAFVLSWMFFLVVFNLM
jgi:tetrahydromethanopterin S-methyltransferase subunit G